MNAQRIVDNLLENTGGNSRKTITVGSIFDALPPETVESVLAVMNSKDDSIEQARRLKTLLRPHADALERIGLIPDYTAYLLIHVAGQARQQQASRN